MRWSVQQGAVRGAWRQCVAVGSTVLLGLCTAGCSAEDVVGGSYRGQNTRSRLVFPPGLTVGMPLDPTPYPSWVWNVTECSNGEAVEVVSGCVIWAVREASAHRFIPGYSCAVGGETYATLDGTYAISGKQVSGSIHLSRTGLRNGATFHEEFTDEVSGMTRDGDVPTGGACKAVIEPVAPVSDFSPVAGCDTIDDHSSAAADRTVLVGPPFNPKCMQIATGQSVAFKGTWTLKPGVPGDQGAGSERNPLPMVAPNGDVTVNVTFDRVGDFLFYATDTGETGMIRVR
jgi:hypothetical protein